MTMPRQELQGLTEAEAVCRLARHGPNVIGSVRRTPVWRRVLAQLRDPLILVLLAAMVLTVATGDLVDASIIGIVVVVNSAVGVAQEVRAEKAVAALRVLSAPVVRVVRDGAEREVNSADIVPGDVVLLGEGDVVPADGRVLEAARLLVDESSLTGESVPVAKETSSHDSSAAAVSAGTVVLRGRGRVEVTATGAASATGRIAALMAPPPGLTPLQHRLARFGRALALVAVVLSAVVLLVGIVRGQPVELMVVAAISLVVAAVPESLPAVVTLALALGAHRMAARHAIVRRLPAVETLGSITVLATDKTGTLTEGRMAAQRLWTPAGGEATVSGTGYAPEGRVERDGHLLWGDQAPDLAELLTAAVLCNDAALRPPGSGDGAWTALGDPTEAALLTAAARFDLDAAVLRESMPRVDEIPFSSERKRMTTVHRHPGGQLRVVCKGAPETVLCGDHIAEDDAQSCRRALARAGEWARDGYRVLAVATADRADSAPDDLENGLRLLGLVAILDPPREAAADTVAACRAAGITPVLVTGDHPLTAEAVARRLGIASAHEEAVTGQEIRGGTAGDPTAVRVFARTTPEQKLGIVESWRTAGHVVAMTGDGVNDGPALRRADIGVAMGRRGTEVARQAADLVLADDDIGTVVAAVEEGRRVYANVRRFLLYALAGGSAEILVMLAGPALGMPLPLLPAQILWINLLTHGLPGVALGAEPTAGDSMHRPPRPPEESVLGEGLWARILALGALIAVVTLAVGYWAHGTGRPWQTLVFLVLGATQLGVGLGSRARPGSLANPFLLLALAAALALQIAGAYVPLLRELLGTQPPALSDVGLAGAAFLLGFAAMRLQAWLVPEGGGARWARPR
ncbi:cation-translocating P-type ATPase [Streptomyces abikoensis]|uniref:cation-translocating P-type ATPase n=1 Tax=Streptomyces abikoensis TaxID=97398 RepID=UPI0019CE897C|nr:cation-transporting P-type ATPase [Streptomyces abikoensis]GGP36816.1 ATPase [Streptomyces abikoensis]